MTKLKLKLKPPDIESLDPYKTLKVPLNSILRKKHRQIVSERINGAIDICNILTTRVYEFISMFSCYQL